MNVWKSPVVLRQSCDTANPKQFCKQLLEIYILVVAAPLIYDEPYFYSVIVLIRHNSTIKLLLLSEFISDLCSSLRIL